MAETAETITPQTVQHTFAYEGTPRNMAVGFAMFAAAVLAFSMNLTDVFFARATAWTFVLWGALFLYIGLMDIYQTYEVSEQGLTIRNPMRPWTAVKFYDWAHLHRLDIVVKRVDAQIDDAVMQFYYTAPGEIALEREDRAYHPELARVIIERAGLKSTDAKNPQDLTQLPKGKATYIWNQSGRMAVS